ncbi:MAG: fibronectin type III domain-containing protein [Sphingobacteriales bacterium]|nr:fibronectin type III domain-containing protein [Sphingobacteriales bacterium]
MRKLDNCHINHNTRALNGLTSSSNYEVQVRSVCASGNSGYTASVTFTTLTSCGVPTNVAVSNVTATGATVAGQP